MDKFIPLPVPGSHLAEILEDNGISQYKLAQVSGLSPTAVGQIIAGKRRITAESAVRIGAALGMSTQFWLNLQSHYDMTLAERALAKKVAQIKPFFNPIPAFS